MHSDATAAIGIARRASLGKIRHLDNTDLWPQDQVRNQSIILSKGLGAENLADVLTNYVDRAILQPALIKMGMAELDGRLACAPAAIAVTT